MHFRVFGVYRYTRERVSFVVEARDEVGAIEIAEARSVDVESVREEESPPPADAPGAGDSARSKNPHHAFAMTVSLCLRVLAWLSFGGCTAMFIVVAAMAESLPAGVRFLQVITGLIAAAVSWVTLMAFAVIIELLCRIETNTRQSASALRAPKE